MARMHYMFALWLFRKTPADWIAFGCSSKSRDPRYVFGRWATRFYGSAAKGGTDVTA